MAIFQSLEYIRKDLYMPCSDVALNVGPDMTCFHPFLLLLMVYFLYRFLANLSPAIAILWHGVGIYYPSIR